MKILAIETSCDDTAVAILEEKQKKLKILSNLVSSQVKLHAPYGGVYPSLAKREHQRNLPLVYKRALKEANLLNPKSKIQNPKLDLIAVTSGPGLEPCLWQGINFANDLAQKLKAPLFPVNHVEAHILANFVRPNSQFSISNFQKLFPAICLVVSGGHTQLILMKKFLDYKILGETRDDAAGECFDKVARILGLGYPGGPVISKLAKNGNPTSLKLPRPMMNQKNYDFSFSGLKTAVLYEFRKQTPEKQRSKQYIEALCAEVQQAIIDVLISKTKKAVNDYGVKTVILGGGVVSNPELRKQFKKAFNVLMPPKEFCTDNAAMVAVTAYYHWKKPASSAGAPMRRNIEAKADLTL